ncbi:unnamed protein product [Dovyalis caffra]|uniref:Uncharacterized protein n=1 Tax=Dovyalis caffra TaxID=77055 RepID=A0AAV1RHY2_9ROSI|nr:unnamed protein product [Dovyalis caffra]
MKVRHAGDVLLFIAYDGPSRSRTIKLKEDRRELSCHDNLSIDLSLGVKRCGVYLHFDENLASKKYFDEYLSEEDSVDEVDYE